MIELYRPKPSDLWFRQELLNDAETMSYNNAWGGTVSFPREKWKSWYDYYLIHHENKRFYRYLWDKESRAYVGEASYRFEEKRSIYICNIIVHAKYRGKGYGTAGLELLCKSAQENGVPMLYDDIAADNPSVLLFVKNGFVIVGQTASVIMVKKRL